MCALHMFYTNDCRIMHKPSFIIRSADDLVIVSYRTMRWAMILPWTISSDAITTHTVRTARHSTCFNQWRQHASIDTWTPFCVTLREMLCLSLQFEMIGWFGKLSMVSKVRLRKVGTLCQKTVGTYSNGLGHIYQLGATQRPKAILADPHQPLHLEIPPLPWRKRCIFPMRTKSDQNCSLSCWVYKQAGGLGAIAHFNKGLIDSWCFSSLLRCFIGFYYRYIILQCVSVVPTTAHEPNWPLGQ